MLIETNAKFQPIVILTLGLDTRIEEQQALAHAGFEKFKTIRGSFEGEKEYGYVVPVNSTEDVKKLVELARTHKQESIMHIEGDSRFASLIPTNPEAPQKPLGEFVAVDPSVAIQHTSWTLDIAKDQFYITKPLEKTEFKGGTHAE